MEGSLTFAIGDSVVVKSSTKDPDFGIDIGGWQGRVSDVPLDENIVGIDWDSKTLKHIPASYITQCEEQGFGWDQIYLEPNDIEPTTARDSLADVENIYQQLQAEHAWDFLGPDAAGVSQVLVGIDPDDEWGLLRAWERHLHKVLGVPFEARVAEFQDRGPLQSGDKVTVQSFSDVEALSGLLVKVHHKRHSYPFPLCDLEAIDHASENYTYLRDYVVWFANR